MTADYQYKELAYARQIYENGILSGQHLPTELRLVATYMRRFLNYKPKKLREELENWCEQHIAGFQKELYFKQLNAAVTKACKKDSTLINIEHVDFFQYELDYLNSLFITDDIDDGRESAYSYDCKKLLFTLLFLTKINRLAASNGQEPLKAQTQKTYFQGGARKYSELKKLAKLPDKVKINEDVIHTLWLNGLVSPLYNGLIRLDFMDELNAAAQTAAPDAAAVQDSDSSVVIRVTDYDAAGWYFDYYNKDKKITFCKGCNRIFKKKTNRQEFCSDDCFLLYRKNYKTQKQRTYRKTDVDS